MNKKNRDQQTKTNICDSYYFVDEFSINCFTTCHTIHGRSTAKTGG